LRKSVSAAPAQRFAAAVQGQCLCGAIHLEIDFPARWAWHDHSSASRQVHGAAYATYVGSWRRRFRITQGQPNITQFADAASGTTRSFCARCGTPICYELAAYGKCAARPVQNPHRSTSALPHRHRTDAGMDLPGRTVGTSQGISRCCLGSLEKETTRPADIRWFTKLAKAGGPLKSPPLCCATVGWRRHSDVEWLYRRRRRIDTASWVTLLHGCPTPYCR